MAAVGGLLLLAHRQGLLGGRTPLAAKPALRFDDIIGADVNGKIALMFDDMISTAGSICSAADVVHRHVALDGHHAGVGVDLHLAVVLDGERTGLHLRNHVGVPTDGDAAIARIAPVVAPFALRLELYEL